jgi:hypothetical protein
LLHKYHGAAVMEWVYLLVMREKFLGVPSYGTELSLKVVFFHCYLRYRSMEFHANQVDAHERWLIADYVLKLKKQIIIVEQTDRNE